MSRENRDNREVIEFVTELCKLEPIEFSGVMYILDIQIGKEDKTICSFEELLSEAIDRFVKMGRRQRKEITKVIKQSLKYKAGEGKNESE